LYADDVKLYSVLNTVHDIMTLQDSLNRLKEWSDTWQLRSPQLSVSTWIYT